MSPKATDTARRITPIHNFGAIFLFAPLLVLLCCSKKNSPPPTPNNNELMATVQFSNGTIVNVNAKGTSASYSCYLGTIVEGHNETNEQVAITINAGGLTCVTNPGTYLAPQVYCEYHSNYLSGSTPTYSTYGSNTVSITFTSVSSSYWEGYFNAVCYANHDSVIVNGTFKGDHLYYFGH